jgi:hypothetical protein
MKTMTGSATAVVVCGVFLVLGACDNVVGVNTFDTFQGGAVRSRMEPHKSAAARPLSSWVTVHRSTSSSDVPRVDVKASGRAGSPPLDTVVFASPSPGHNVVTVNTTVELQPGQSEQQKHMAGAQSACVCVYWPGPCRPANKLDSASYDIPLPKSAVTIQLPTHTHAHTHTHTHTHRCPVRRRHGHGV